MGGDEYGGAKWFSSMPEVREWRATSAFRLRERRGTNSLQGLGVLELRMWIQHSDRQRRDHSRPYYWTELQVVTLISASPTAIRLGEDDFPFKEFEGLVRSHQVR